MFPSDDERNPYLEHEVLSAGPARLRWMLIRRAEELCVAVEQLWQAGQWHQADQWLLRIREILGELLAGVTSGDDPLRAKIADLYIFMIQHLIEVEKTRSPIMLATLRHLLNIESQTWLQVVEKQAAVDLAPVKSSANPHLQSDTLNYESLSIEA